jgi:hypothetical protein
MGALKMTKAAGRRPYHGMFDGGYIRRHDWIKHSGCRR